MNLHANAALTISQRGEFTGLPTNVNGLALLADGKLVAGCNDDALRVWGFRAALQKNRSR